MNSPTMRIRILKSFATPRYGLFWPGQIAIVPKESADPWIKAGMAEEDKSLDGPPETKEMANPPKFKRKKK